MFGILQRIGLKYKPLDKEKIGAFLLTIFLFIVLYHHWSGSDWITYKYARELRLPRKQDVHTEKPQAFFPQDPSELTFIDSSIPGLYIYNQEAVATADVQGKPVVMITSLWRHGNLSSVRDLKFICVLSRGNNDDFRVKGVPYLLDSWLGRKPFPVWPIMCLCFIPEGRKLEDYSHVRIAREQNRVNRTIDGSQQKRCQPSPCISIQLPIKQIQPQNVSGEFAACVKYSYYDTSAFWLAEWMEMQRLLDLSHVIMYDYGYVSWPVAQLLRYYKACGLVHVQPWKHPLTSGWDPESGAEIYENGQFAMINDCLHRFGHQFENLIFLDLDEIIVPSNTAITKTYKQLILDLVKSVPRSRRPGIAGFKFRSVEYCVPGDVMKSKEEGLLTAKYLTRTDPVRIHTKMIVRPPAIFHLGVHNEGRVRLGYHTKSIKVAPDVAKVHHYRYRARRDRDCYIRDLALKPYWRRLRSNVHVTLNAAFKSNPEAK